MSVPALIFLVATPALYAAVSVLLKMGGTGKVPPFAAMAVSGATLAVLGAGLSLLLERGFVWSSPGHRRELSVLCLSGVVNVAGLWCLLKALGLAPVWQQQMFGVLGPVFAALLGFLLLGEACPPRLFVGLGFISVGLYFAVK